MSSLRKLAAARANGGLALGRKTPEGKARSAHNALRHGLLAQCVLIEGECPERFQQLFNQFVQRFQPDEVEYAFVEEMAAAYWRSRRAWTIETRLMDSAIQPQPSGDQGARIAAAFSTLASQPQLPLLHRYEARLQRAFQRALKNLLLLREQKLPNDANPISGHSPTAPDIPSQYPPPQPDNPPPVPAQLCLGPLS